MRLRSKWMHWCWSIIFQLNCLCFKHIWFISLVNKFYHWWILYFLLCNNSLDHVCLHFIVGLRMSNYSYFRHIQIIICINILLFYIWVLHHNFRLVDVLSNFSLQNIRNISWTSYLTLSNSSLYQVYSKFLKNL